MKHVDFMQEKSVNFSIRYYILFLGLILFSMVAQLLFVLHFSVDVPYWDQFANVRLLKNPTLRGLFYQHNEHRLIVPKLFFIILAKITHWSVFAEIFFNWLFLQFSAILLFRILIKNVNKDKIWAIAISLCFFLTPQYYNDLLWGFQNCVQINLLAVMSAIYIFCSVKSAWLRIHLAIVSCIIATFSLANGLLVWLAFFPLVFIANRKDEPFYLKLFFKREGLKVIYWIIAAIIVTVVYFWHYRIQMPHHYPLAYPWAYPKQFLLYFFAYLGSSLVVTDTNLSGVFIYIYIILGIVLCLVFILGCIFRLFNIRKNIFKLCLVIFVFLTAAATSFGRANFPLIQASETKYRIFTILLPILLIGMLISGRGIKTAFGKIIFVLLISGMLIGIFSGWLFSISGGRIWYSSQQENLKILYSFQTATDSQLKNLYPSAQTMREMAFILKDLRYSVFR